MAWKFAKRASSISALSLNTQNDISRILSNFCGQYYSFVIKHLSIIIFDNDILLKKKSQIQYRKNVKEYWKPNWFSLKI